MRRRGARAGAAHAGRNDRDDGAVAGVNRGARARRRVCRSSSRSDGRAKGVQLRSALSGSRTVRERRSQLHRKHRRNDGVGRSKRVDGERDRTPGPNKGTALKLFLERPPFAGFTPVMVGDDLTDENAFAAAHEMGGYGIMVGSERPSRAWFRIPSVPDVMSWLEQNAVA